MKKINVITFVCFIFLVSIVNFIFHTNNEISILENKKLQLKPEISINNFINNNLSQKMDAYVSDQFVLRTDLITIAHKLKTFTGIQSGITIDVVKNDNTLENNTNPDSGKSTVDNQSETTGVDSEIHLIGDLTVNYLIFDDSAVASFVENFEAEKAYTKIVKKYALIKENLNVKALIAPTLISFIDKKYSNLTDDQYASILRVKALFKPEIMMTDVYPILKENYSEHIYFRTDHHWNGFGAYLAYRQFCLASGMVPVDLSEMTALTYPNYIGSLFKVTGNAKLSDRPDTIEVFIPDVPVVMNSFRVTDGVMTPYLVDKPYAISTDIMGSETSYQIFLGGDSALTVIKTDKDTEKDKILVIKDSYGNAFLPFLSLHYKEVHAIDPRYYVGSISEYILDHQIDEVLFLNNANVTRTMGYIDLLKERY